MFVIELIDTVPEIKHVNRKISKYKVDFKQNLEYIMNQLLLEALS